MDKVEDVTTAETRGNGHAESVKKTVREGIESAKEHLAEGYEKVSHKAHEVWDKAADKSLNDVVHSVNDYVRHKPGKCMLMAAGAGLILGLLLRGHRG